jgi:large conductance mechanosensitive channel
VKSFTSSLITPIIAAIGAQPDFSALTFQINGSTFRYGAFINALITLLISAILTFLVVKVTLRAFPREAGRVHRRGLRRRGDQRPIS